MSNLHKLWHHRWITSKAKSIDSKISGKGIMAIAPLKKGEIVMVVSGVVIPRSGIWEYRKKMGHIRIQIHDNFWIVPTSRKELDETGAPNHSCSPNLGFDGPITYVALRNIKKGEELVLDYAFMESDFNSFPCNCSSKNCRKTITPNDWKLKSLQKKYGKYFSPYLQKKF